ncbi:MAG: alpha/beta hydrolase [Alphaproteobacteria bacterium]|nr:alpha/beta hydrolase [Alphaproteobacteria bacterium]
MDRTPPQPRIDDRGPPRVKRWEEQRWLIDNIIRANGIDWDQPRSMYLSAPCGVQGNADFAAIRQRVQKMADIGPAFAATARRREEKARDAQAAGLTVTARDNFFMAAIHWGAAQWPYDENNETNLAYNQRKRECYENYARLSDHRVEATWIPFKDSALPAWFHLPPGFSGGRLPCVIAIPGMDSFKEMAVALYGDRWLSRGIAVLALDGPGQYEAPILEINVSMENWIATGTAVVDWLAERGEIDADRIGVTGNSFGSFFGTIAAANEPRLRACAVVATCLEPGCHTIFEEASPTFKKRFMYMSGYTDEAAFDEFCRTLTWEGHVDRIRCPYLCVAGEAEELSPLECAERLMQELKAPKRLVVYQDSRHSVGNVPAANLGPFPPVLVADWMARRLDGEPFPSERWYVEANGHVVKTPY